MQLKDKVALVTGGTSGIGAATARRFAREGAWTFVLGRNARNGEDVVRQIHAAGGKARFIACDVALEADIRRAFDDVIGEAGTLDILFNCAGVAPSGTIEELCTDLWKKTFAINVESVYHFSRLAVPVMRRAGGGVIINVSSSAGTVGAWGMHLYAASKGAVVQLSRSMAADYARENIRVNCLCPGATVTPMMDQLGAEGMQEFAKLIPAGRMASADEIANVALFLAGDQSSFMFGSTVLVDGGFTAI